MKNKKITIKNIKQDENISETSSDSNNSEEDINKTINKNNSDSKKPRQRQENSLGELTKNFIKYIKEKGDNVVHINEVVKILKVKKRRIYDITNVLEGNLSYFIYYLI